MRGSNEIKRFAACLSVLLLLSALSVPVLADDIEEIGNFSGNHAQSGKSETGDSSQQQEENIALSGGVTYSKDKGLFCYTVESSSFGISVPDGTILTGSVSAELSPSLTGVLYKNGSEVIGADISNISSPGKYVLAVTANDAAETVRVSFTILSNPSCAVREYIIPLDFFVVSATLNGENASYSQTYVDMSSDGEYDIRYRSPKADRDMELHLTIDHTPPAATLTGITDGKANGPVTVSDVEDDVSVYLLRNGTQTSFDGTISETGAYVLTLRDRAGNETSYDFVVVTYANTSLKALLTATGLLILGLVGYLLYFRKYMRVR